MITFNNSAINFFSKLFHHLYNLKIQRRSGLEIKKKILKKLWRNFENFLRKLQIEMKFENI